jgi:hypothetical protein
MVSFDNTENAFKAKSNRDLNRSYWLFKLVSNPALVNFGAKTAQIPSSNSLLAVKPLTIATVPLLSLVNTISEQYWITAWKASIFSKPFATSCCGELIKGNSLRFSTRL